MNVIYKVWDKFTDISFEKCYAEIKFQNEDETFQATMPFLILAENYAEAENVLGQITDTLRDTYRFTILKSGVDEKIINNEVFKKKEQELLDRLKALPKEKIGTITFESHNW